MRTIIFMAALPLAGGVMLGSEAVRKLRDLGCRTKSIHCSTNMSAEDMQKYTDAGADLLWSKPYPRPMEILKTLEGLILPPGGPHGRLEGQKDYMKVLLCEDDEINT